MKKCSSNWNFLKMFLSIQYTQNTKDATFCDSGPWLHWKQTRDLHITQFGHYPDLFNTILLGKNSSPLMVARWIFGLEEIDWHISYQGGWIAETSLIAKHFNGNGKLGNLLFFLLKTFLSSKCTCAHSEARTPFICTAFCWPNWSICISFSHWPVFFANNLAMLVALSLN